MKDGLDRLERAGPKAVVAGHQYEPGTLQLMMPKNRAFGGSEVS